MQGGSNLGRGLEIHCSVGEFMSFTVTNVDIKLNVARHSFLFPCV